MDKYADSVALIVNKIFGVQAEVKLTRPDSNFGDFATNVALQIAKEIGDNPRNIAEKIVEELGRDQVFESVEIAGPGFINLRLPAEKLNSDIEELFFGEKAYGDSSDGAGKVAVVEYPSPNMAKPYSVGHLRSGNQGWAARNLLQATGWNVITDDHLGDYGAPFGIWVVGFKKFSSEEQLDEGGVYELGRVYVETRVALKDEAERGESTLADEAQNWLLKLEDNDPEAVRLSERFNQISLEHIHGVMARLGISTDYEYGEKFFAPLGKKSVQELLEQGIAVQNDDGSVIVDLSDQGIETPLLVQKSNGAALYATTDLATIQWREQNWHPDKVVYCVGAEQKFYFEQLAALARKLKIDTEIYHLWFGTIDQMTDDGKREKMSSRKGVVLMEELLDAAEKKARENTKSYDMTDEDIRKISVGAIKFSDFAADRRTGLLFDWDAMFNLTGFSGPYAQYAAVRVNKILKDNDFILNPDNLRVVNRDIVAGFIFSKDGKILLGKNVKGGVYDSSLAVPGGGIENGETEVEALRREMLEEVDIDIAGSDISKINVSFGQTTKTLRDTGETVWVRMKFHNYKIQLAGNSDEIKSNAQDDFATAEWYATDELSDEMLSTPTRRNLQDIGSLKTSAYDYLAEKDLLLKLSEYPGVVSVAARELEPHRIAAYVYELARELNRYYEKTPVGTADVPADIKTARLEILRKVSQVFAHGLGILGIDIPDKM